MGNIIKIVLMDMNVGLEVIVESGQKFLNIDNKNRETNEKNLFDSNSSITVSYIAGIYNYSFCYKYSVNNNYISKNKK